MTGADRTPVLAASDLVKTYDAAGGPVAALRGVDFELARGDLVVLLGPSGSGKSTLLNLIGGLDRVTTGRLLFGGTDLAALDERALTFYRRRHVGFVFQSYNLIPSLTAGENVTLGTVGAERALAPDKALALVEVAQSLGVERENVLALGDGRNDIEMLAWAGRGVAIGDASPEVQAAADEVTGCFADGGTAAELDRWFGPGA